MSPILDPFRVLVVTLAGWMNQQQQDVIEYLKEENRVSLHRSEALPEVLHQHQVVVHPALLVLSRMRQWEMVRPIMTLRSPFKSRLTRGVPAPQRKCSIACTTASPDLTKVILTLEGGEPEGGPSTPPPYFFRFAVKSRSTPNSGNSCLN